MTMNVTEFEVPMPGDDSGGVSGFMRDWTPQQREAYGNAFARAQTAAGRALVLISFEVQSADHALGNFNWRLIVKVGPAS